MIGLCWRTAFTGGCGRVLPWADIPERYGPPTTCYNRFVRWRKVGVWDRIFEAVLKAYDGDLQMIDLLLDPPFISTRPTSKRGSGGDRGKWHDAPARYMGRSRGGLTTKIHALVDANGNPDRAQAHSKAKPSDGKSASDLLKRLGAGQTLLADRAYDSDAPARGSLSAARRLGNIKPMPGRVNIPAFSAFLYRYRNLVERFFNKLKLLQSHRHALRKTRRQLSRPRQTRRGQNLDAVYGFGDLVIWN